MSKSWSGLTEERTRTVTIEVKGVDRLEKRLREFREAAEVAGISLSRPGMLQALGLNLSTGRAVSAIDAIQRELEAMETPTTRPAVGYAVLLLALVGLTLLIAVGG